jgi:hypothetical protein
MREFVSQDVAMKLSFYVLLLLMADEGLGDITPHYVPVVVECDERPQCGKWKAWRSQNTDQVIWEIIGMVKHVMPNVDTESKNFRVNKMFENEMKLWVRGLHAEGLSFAAVFFPSLKSCVARNATVTLNNHRAASLSTHGLVSWLAWCSQRPKRVNGEAGCSSFQALLFATLPQLTESTLAFGALFEEHKQRCQHMSADGFCIHIQAVRLDLASNAERLVARVVHFLADLGKYRDCSAALGIYTSLLANLSNLIESRWDEQAPACAHAAHERGPLP